MFSSFVSSFKREIALEEKANIQFELTRIAAALAILRAEHGRYPDKLDELVPTVLKELPRDLLHRKPYIYRPDGGGYLLYSTGENGIDDGSLNGQTRFFESPPFDERGRTGRNPDAVLPVVPMGADDISIHLPHPSLEIPNLL